VQYPVHGGLAEARLGGDLADPVRVLHGVQNDGLLRSYQDFLMVPADLA
jgi:hypothetical protein